MRAPRWQAAVRLVVCALFAAAPSLVLAQNIPPAPTSWVTDTVGLLSPETASSLDDRLRTYESRTGHQILVYISATTGGVPIEDWAVRAFERWKVGRKGLDDGVVLFIFVRDRTLRIEVGYGLEPKIPDAAAARIVRDTIEPGLRAGEPDQAVTAGVDQILALAGDEGPQASAAPSSETDNAQQAPLSSIELILIGVALLVLLGVAVRSPWFAMYLLFNIFGGGRGGGFSGSSGFSGGGGRSGGGGASGRW